MLRLSNILFYSFFCAVVFLPRSCQQRVDKAPKEQTVSTPAEKQETTADSTASFTVVSEGTRVALIEPCGRCHQSTLDTHKAGAIAIFDLDKGEAWHTTLKEEHLSGLERRAMGNASISEEEREQIVAFLAQKRNLLVSE